MPADCAARNYGGDDTAVAHDIMYCVKLVKAKNLRADTVLSKVLSMRGAPSLIFPAAVVFAVTLLAGLLARKRARMALYADITDQVGNCGQWRGLSLPVQTHNTPRGPALLVCRAPGGEAECICAQPAENCGA